MCPHLHTRRRSSFFPLCSHCGNCVCVCVCAVLSLSNSSLSLSLRHHKQVGRTSPFWRRRTKGGKSSPGDERSPTKKGGKQTATPATSTTKTTWVPAAITLFLFLSLMGTTEVHKLGGQREREREKGAEDEDGYIGRSCVGRGDTHTLRERERVKKSLLRLSSRCYSSPPFP